MRLCPLSPEASLPSNEAPIAPKTSFQTFLAMQSLRVLDTCRLTCPSNRRGSLRRFQRKFCTKFLIDKSLENLTPTSQCSSLIDLGLSPTPNRKWTTTFWTDLKANRLSTSSLLKNLRSPQGLVGGESETRG